MAGKQTRQIKETDLYAPLRDYLVEQDYIVRSEVMNCDVTAAKGDDLIVIELKRTLNITLLAQAIDRQRITDSVYVAIPRPSNKRKWMSQSKDVQGVLKRLEIGLILVATNSRRPKVEILFHPVPFERRKRSARRRAVIREMERRTGDFNQGGSCRRKLMTAYRENAIQIACILDELGPTTPRKLRSLGTGLQTLPILYKNFYSWFDKVDRGLYTLSPKGKAELSDYPELVNYYKSSLIDQLDPLTQPEG